MLEICRDLFNQWNSTVLYCHWKSNEHLVDGLLGLTDLDVFVLPKDQALAERGLSECNYIKVIPQKGCRYPHVDEWIGFDNSTGKLVHIHLHYQIITGKKYNKEYVFPIDELVINSRVLDQTYKVYTIDPSLEIIILYCRVALKANNKKNIQPNLDVHKEIEYLNNQLDKNKLNTLCFTLFGSAGEIIYNSIIQHDLSKNEWYRLYTIVKDWLKPYRKSSSLKVQLLYYYHKLRISIQSSLNRRLGTCFINKKTINKGFSICFIGQDGCGKSTNTITIKKWLNWKIAAERFYLGSGDHYSSFLKRFIAKSRKSNMPSANNKSVNASAKNNSKSFKKWIGQFLISYNFYLVAKRTYKSILRANKYVDKGGIALFDRFPQNQIPGYYDGPKIESQCFAINSTWLVRLMSRCEKKYIKKAQSLQPDLIFKLVLSPEESLRRKPEENIEMIKKKAHATQVLNFDRSKTIIINAEQPFETELIEIKNHIWNYLLENDN